MSGIARRRRLGLIALETVMVIAALLYIYPIFLMFINSLKPFGEVVSDVIALPKAVTLQNYVDVVDRMRYFQLFSNNVIITAIGVTGIVALASLAAYVLERRRTRYAKLAYLVIITPMLIPFQTFMITLLKVMTVAHLSGSTWGLGIQYWGFGVPMAVFIYFNFMNTIPRELDESALMDGATTFRCFRSIIFPMLKTITTTVVVLDVMWIWNDFLLPLLMVNGRPETKTLVLSAYTFVGQFNTQWHYAMTAMVLTVLPSIVIFVALQRNIVQGVVAGAIKG
jgi:raffinose/stachyose/melibiose transport system permease protein